MEYAADTGVGSDFSDVDITALTDTLADIGGFDDTIRRMREDHMAYFDDSTGEDVFFSIYGKIPGWMTGKPGTRPENSFIVRRILQSWEKKR